MNDNSKNEPKPCFDEWVKGMVKTQNQMGIMTLELSPPAKAFAEFAKHAKQPVLDVGCAYGVSSLAALKTGAVVKACDMEQAHLSVLEDMVPQQFKHNLTTYCAAFPDDLNFEENSLSAIHMTMILHFLTGETIVRGLKKCHSWLAPGGKLFIGNMTPYLGLYEWEKLSAEYDKRIADGCEWPGEIAQREFAKGEWKKNLPPLAHFFKKDSMLKIANMAGFEVNSVYYYCYDDIPEEYKTNGKEYVGMEATKI